MTILERAEAYAKEEYKSNDDFHQWKHVEDVWSRAQQLLREHPDANEEIVRLAVIFHDIDYASYETHVDASVVAARKFLRTQEYPHKRIDQVTQAMFDHSNPHRKKRGDAKTIEGQIVYDADKSIFITDHKTYCKYYPLLYTARARDLVIQQMGWKKIQITNNAGERLVGVLHKNLSDTLIILCHGLADTKENPFLVAIAQALESEGISVFRFDFSGNGESDGQFEEATYHKEADDLDAMLAHFRRKGVKRFILAGHSMGGGVIRVAAARNKDVAAIVSIAGVARADSFKDKFPDIIKKVKEEGRAYMWGETYGEKYPITQKYLDSTNTIDIMALAPELDIPSLCIIGSKDSLIRREQETQFLDKMPSHDTELAVLDGFDHVFGRDEGSEKAQRGQQALIDTIVPWVIARK